MNVHSYLEPPFIGMTSRVAVWPRDLRPEDIDVLRRLGDSSCVSRFQSARVRAVHRVVVSECVGVGGRSRARNQEWVAADEAAEGRVVEARAELGDAESGEGVAEVPLAVAVKLATRLFAGRRQLAE